MSRSTVRAVVSVIVVSQCAVVWAFLAGFIREPYPAVILPAFDQVLVDEHGVCSFLVPRFSVRMESGEVAKLSHQELTIPGVTPTHSFWLTARLAAPESARDWKPSLPSYNYPFDPPVRSKRFLDLLAESASQLPGNPKELTIRWEWMRFSTSGGRLHELESEPVGSVVVSIGND